MKRVAYLLLPVLVLTALAPFAPFTQSALAVRGAAFTTVNVAMDGAGHCANGNPAVNCNIYNGKQYVWLNGGPVANKLGPSGSFFFAVLAPGGQPNANDGSPKNLSDNYDAYTNRMFTIAKGKVSAYTGMHTFDRRFIRLYPYANTPNPGGVYILAICSLANGYPVKAKDCKYDQFKIMKAVPNSPTPTATNTAPPASCSMEGGDGRWAEFNRVGAGTSVETPNAVMDGLTISARADGWAVQGMAVSVEEGNKTAIAYFGLQPTAKPGESAPTPAVNAGINSRYGGMYDTYARIESEGTPGPHVTAAPGTPGPHGSVYTFKFTIPVFEFRVYMLDFGDWNPTNDTNHLVTCTAKLANGSIIQHELKYKTEPEINPTSMELAGDALNALPGQPGNWLCDLNSPNNINIVQVTVNMERGWDPNHALHAVCVRP